MSANDIQFGKVQFGPPPAPEGVCVGKVRFGNDDPNVLRANLTNDGPHVFHARFMGQTTHVQPVETKHGQWREYYDRGAQGFGVFLQAVGIVLGFAGPGAGIVFGLPIYLVGSAVRGMDRAKAEGFASRGNGNNAVINTIKCITPVTGW